MDQQPKHVEVTATVGFHDHGRRCYRTIVYSCQHWEEAMIMLFATNAWQLLMKQLERYEIPLIYGITFAFKNKSNGKSKDLS